MTGWLVLGGIAAWTTMVTGLIFGPEVRSLWHKMRARWTVWSLSDYDREVLDEAKVNW